MTKRGCGQTRDEWNASRRSKRAKTKAFIAIPGFGGAMDLATRTVATARRNRRDGNALEPTKTQKPDDDIEGETDSDTEDATEDESVNTTGDEIKDETEIEDESGKKTRDEIEDETEIEDESGKKTGDEIEDDIGDESGNETGDEIEDDTEDDDDTGDCFVLVGDYLKLSPRQAYDKDNKVFHYPALQCLGPKYEKETKGKQITLLHLDNNECKFCTVHSGIKTEASLHGLTINVYKLDLQEYKNAKRVCRVPNELAYSEKALLKSENVERCPLPATYIIKSFSITLNIEVGKNYSYYPQLLFSIKQ